MSGSAGEIRQQVGEILATVRALDRAQEDTKRSVERAVDSMQRDMNALKHEARNGQQVLQGKLEIAGNKHTLMEQRLEKLEASVDALKAPVEQWVSLRKRVIAFGLMAASVCAVMWAIVQPLWGPFVQRLIGLR